MGLDMYLEADKYITAYCHDDNNKVHDNPVFRAVVDAAQLGSVVRDELFQGATVTVQVAYWRKANAIHGWFVNNVQDGKDECQRSYVSVDQLQELYDLCVDLLERKNPNEAEQRLPPTGGFFFGSYDIDDWYWKDLQDTVDQIGKLIPFFTSYDFYYQASW